VINLNVGLVFEKCVLQCSIIALVVCSVIQAYIACGFAVCQALFASTALT